LPTTSVTTSIPPPTTVQRDVIDSSFLMESYGIAMYADGGFAARVTLTHAASADYLNAVNVTLSLTVDDVLWAAPGVDPKDVEGQTATFTQIAAKQQAQWLDRFGYPQQGIALFLRDFEEAEGFDAMFAPEGAEEMKPWDGEDGMLRLVDILRDLRTEAIPQATLTPADPCATPKPTPAVYPDSVEDALIGHLEYAAWLSEQAKPADYENIADQIVESIEQMIDPVTGEAVEPNPSDIVRQLERGVAPENVVIPRVVQMGSDPTDFEGTETRVVLVGESGEFLGTYSIRGHRRTIVDIEAPNEGEDLLVYLVSGFPDYYCTDWLALDPFIVIPHNEVAGTLRAEIRFADRTHTVLSDAG
jgi:hypothetical protein